MKKAKSSLIVLVCIGVVLQMLGAPISFWDLDGSDDDFISSLLMGACILTGDPHISRFHSFLTVVQTSAPRYSFLHEDFPFHPPN
jgi:hypothetical protein